MGRYYIWKPTCLHWREEYAPVIDYLSGSVFLPSSPEDQKVSPADAVSAETIDWLFYPLEAVHSGARKLPLIHDPFIRTFRSWLHDHKDPFGKKRIDELLPVWELNQLKLIAETGFPLPRQKEAREWLTTLKLPPPWSSRNITILNSLAYSTSYPADSLLIRLLYKHLTKSPDQPFPHIGEVDEFVPLIPLDTRAILRWELLDLLLTDYPRQASSKADPLWATFMDSEPYIPIKAEEARWGDIIRYLQGGGISVRPFLEIHLRLATSEQWRWSKLYSVPILTYAFYLRRFHRKLAEVATEEIKKVFTDFQNKDKPDILDCYQLERVVVTDIVYYSLAMDLLIESHEQLFPCVARRGRPQIWRGQADRVAADIYALISDEIVNLAKNKSDLFLPKAAYDLHRIGIDRWSVAATIINTLFGRQVTIDSVRASVHRFKRRMRRAEH